MKILLSYPGLMPPTSQALQAFHELGLLHSFATTFVCQPKSVFFQRLSKVLPSRVLSELRRRELTDIPPELVKTYPAREFRRIILSKLGASERMLDWAWEDMALNFDREVANSLTTDVSAVYGYEHVCRNTFERAGQIGAHRIYDLAAPHFSFLEKVILGVRETNAADFPDQWDEIHSQDKRRNTRKSEEFALSDLVIANSNFTAKTLIDTGYPANKVKVVPLGGPTPIERLPVKGTKQPPVFLFVGSVSVRKGFPHLIEAWRSLGSKVPGELVVAGKWDLATSLRAQLPSTIKLLGSIPHAELGNWFERSSLLILPSLCDGFGMVVTEALAKGIPVLTTSNTGAADLIVEGKNGWVVSPANSDALAEKISWCLAHAEELEGMRTFALQTARENTWKHFRGRLTTTIVNYFDSK